MRDLMLDWQLRPVNLVFKNSEMKQEIIDGALRDGKFTDTLQFLSRESWKNGMNIKSIEFEVMK